MEAITLSRQLGSQGDEIAQTVASRLRYRVVYRELINQAANRAGAPEMALAVLDVLGLLDIQPSSKEVEAYQQAMQQVMTELTAQEQVVIIGRAGCVLLKDRPNILHVRVVAPLQQRVERVARLQAITPEAARAQVEASDEARRAYVYQHHRVDWDDPQLYDLVLNLGKLTPDGAAALICLAHAQALTPLGQEPLIYPGA